MIMTKTLLMCIFVLEFAQGRDLWEQQAEVGCQILEDRSDVFRESGKVYLVDCSKNMGKLRLSDNIIKNDSLRHVIYEKDCF